MIQLSPVIWDVRLIVIVDLSRPVYVTTLGWTNTLGDIGGGSKKPKMYRYKKFFGFYEL
jgi:hypothetical protein